MDGEDYACQDCGIGCRIVAANGQYDTYIKCDTCGGMMEKITMRESLLSFLQR